MGAYILIMGFFSADGILSMQTANFGSAVACVTAGNAYVASTTTGFYNCNATGVTNYKLMVTLGGIGVSMGTFTTQAACNTAGFAWKVQQGTSKQYTFLCSPEQ